MRTTGSSAFDLLRLVYDCMAGSRGWDTTDYGLTKRSRDSDLPPAIYHCLPANHHGQWPSNWIHLFVTDPELSSEWKELYELLHLRYWQRLWIVQEILLAKDILLAQGFETCPWGCLTAFFVLQEIYGRQVIGSSWVNQERKGFARSLGEHRELREKYPGSSLRLYDLLSAFEKSSCQDPRDKIFGFVGLLRPSAREAIIIDYSKPLLEFFGDIIQKVEVLTPGTTSLIPLSYYSALSCHRCRFRRKGQRLAPSELGLCA
jgi:hypothetical protein